MSVFRHNVDMSCGLVGIARSYSYRIDVGAIPKLGLRGLGLLFDLHHYFLSLRGRVIEAPINERVGLLRQCLDVEF